jgi:hypothetical protein
MLVIRFIASSRRGFNELHPLSDQGMDKSIMKPPPAALESLGTGRRSFPDHDQKMTQPEAAAAMMIKKLEEPYGIELLHEPGFTTRQCRGRC